jgi:ribosomal protein L7Ae-like RNA K-turn-binding protein
MVAASSLFLLQACLTASSYPCRHGHTADGRRHLSPFFNVKSSSLSRSSSPRREERKKSFLSAQSAGIEGQVDEDAKSSRLDINHQVWRWESKYVLLKQFNDREGHCRVPCLHKEDEANLGRWVSHQRRLKAKDELESDRQKQLEEIGFEWMSSATWDKMCALLKQFKKREGHCNVPRSHTEDKANLGTWVNTQRQLKRKDELDPDKQMQLEDVGFEWVLLSTKWDKTCVLLQQFKKREGHCNVPHLHTEDEANLGKWVSTQRNLKRIEQLDPNRQKQLEEIGFEWVASATWDEMHALLQQFKKREGHCKVPRSHIEDEATLGMWVNNQRILKTKEKLDPDRQKRLEEIGFNWARQAKAP